MDIDPTIREKLGLKEITQIGMVVRDLEAMVDYYKKLGFGPIKIVEPEYQDQTYRGKPGNFKFRFAQFNIGPLEIEVIDPIKGPTIYHEFLEKNKEGGIHHLGFNTSDMDQKIKEFDSMGIGVIQSGRRDLSRWTYMDTEGIGGIILELYDKKTS